MRLTHVIRLANNTSIEALKNSIKIKVAEAPQYLQTVKEENKKILYNKLSSLNKWYNKIIGLDEVNLYLERVASLQKDLLVTQEKRREVSGQLKEIRQRCSEVQDKIQQIDRKEKFNVYCELIKEEREVIFLERTASNKFQEYDQMERDLFTAFTNAIRDSNEKQRAQVEYTKYLGFILSITGSFLAFIYTTYKKNDLKLFIDEKLASMAPTNVQLNTEPLVQIFNEHAKKNEKLMEELLKHRAVLSNAITFLSNPNEMMTNKVKPLVIQPSLEPIEDGEMKIVALIAGIFVTCIVMRILMG